MGSNVNSNIPLQAGAGVLSPWQYAAQQAQAQQQQMAAQISAAKLAEIGRDEQGQNALRQLYADPSNLGQNGQPTPQAFAKLMAANPTTGLDLKAALTKDNTGEANLALLRAKEGDEVIKQKYLVGKTGLSAYQDIINSGGTPEEARAAGQAVYTEGRDTFAKSGLGTPDVVNSFPPNFDPTRASRTVNAYEQMTQKPGAIPEQRQFTEQTDYGTSPPTKYREYKDGRNTTLTDKPYTPTGIGEPKAQEEKLYVGKGTDGKEVRYRYGPQGAVDENNDPIDAAKLTNVHTVGAEKTQTPAAKAFDKFMDEHPNATADEQTRFLESQRPARSGPAAAVRKYMDENPNATAADIAAFNAWQRETSAGAQAFGTGAQGNTTRAQNVAIDHLHFLSGDLAPALSNGDMRALNSLKNWAKTELGYEGPVDFNFAKAIVSQEINKGIVNVGAGTGDERKNLADSLSDANSPEQLNGVIASAKRLMAGQLRGLQQQYVDVTLPPAQRADPSAVSKAQSSFQQKLFPATIQELGLISPGGAASGETGGSQAGKVIPIAPASPAAAAPSSGGAPQNVGGIPTYSTEEQFKAHPPTGPWRRSDDPPGKVRMP